MYVKTLQVWEANLSAIQDRQKLPNFRAEFALSNKEAPASYEPIQTQFARLFRHKEPILQSRIQRAEGDAG
jgi:hypothetical protein